MYAIHVKQHLAGPLIDCFYLPQRFSSIEAAEAEIAKLRSAYLSDPSIPRFGGQREEGREWHVKPC